MSNWPVIDAERIALGQPEDYKPNLCKLPSGELLATWFTVNGPAKGTRHLWGRDVPLIREDIMLSRSSDGGRTWSKPENISEANNLLGREPYLNRHSSGAILITVHFLPQEVRNDDRGRTPSFVHRSTDNGQTWTMHDASPDIDWFMVCTSRNILELHDGSLIMGVSDNKPGEDYIWRSFDGGESWSSKTKCAFPGIKEDYPYPVFGETVLYQTPGGKWLAIVRIDSHYVPALAGTDTPEGTSDHNDRLILYSSTDDGASWHFERDFGDYGQMYPHLTKLSDGRLLLTFTQRESYGENRPPLGLRGLVGSESDDDIHFDFTGDVVFIEANTPLGQDSGGGFGNTVQLDDATLVSAYSYRDANGGLHCEVARWRLPD